MGSARWEARSARWEAHLHGASRKQGTADDAIHRDPILVLRRPAAIEPPVHLTDYINLSATNQLGWREAIYTLQQSQHPVAPPWPAAPGGKRLPVFCPRVAYDVRDYVFGGGRHEFSRGVP